MGETVEYATATTIPLDSLPSLLQFNGDIQSNGFITPTAYTTQDGETILILPQFSTLVLTGDGANGVPIQHFVTGPFAVHPENGQAIAVTQEGVLQSASDNDYTGDMEPPSVLTIGELGSKKQRLNEFGNGNILILPANEATRSQLGYAEPINADQSAVEEDFSNFLHEDGRYHCDRCSEEFDRPRQLKRHLADHKKEKPLKCRSCTATFNIERNLVLHEASHNLTPNSSCPICDKRFLRIAGLCSHLRIHQVDDMVSCDRCKAEFDLQSELEEHVGLVHDAQMTMAPRTSYECRHCQVAFSELSNYRKHIAEHRAVEKEARPAKTRRRRGKQNIPPEIISPSANQSVPPSDETANIVSSSEAAALSAQEISAVPVKRGRGRAPTEHSNKCSHCGKTFRSKMLLDRHVLIHTGERPFACDQCNKSFNQKSALNLHKMCHSGEKPHHCQFCFASFTQRGNLRAHIKSCHRVPQDVTAPNIYRCGACSCTFRRLSTYNAHLTLRHVAGEDSSTVPPQRKRQRIVLPPNPTTLVTSEQSTVSHRQSNSDNEQTHAMRTRSGRLSSAGLKSIARGGDNEGTSSRMGLDASSAADNGAVSTLPSDSLLYTYLPNVDNSAGVAEDVTYAVPPPEIAGPSTTTIPVVEETFENVTVVDPDTNSVQHHRVTRINGVLYHCCSFCDKRFRKTSDFVRHMRIHTCEKPFSCSVCGNRFTNKSTLNTHMRVHAGPAAKRFRCHVCRKFFASPSSLKVHLRVHTGSRPYKCQLCDKSFRTSSHRQDHMLKHQRTRQVIQQRVMAQSQQKQREPLPGVQHFFMQSGGSVQDVTSVAPSLLFSTATGLNDISELEAVTEDVEPIETMQGYQHSLVPLGGSSTLASMIDPERKFTCPHCPKAYKKSDHLRYHLESTHGSGERSYSCRVCGKQFAMWAVLRNHIRTHAKHDLAANEQGGTDFSTLTTYEQVLLQHVGSRPQQTSATDLVEQVTETARFELVHSSDANVLPRIETMITSRSELEVDDFDSANIDHLCFHCGRNFASDSLVRAHVNLEHQEAMQCNLGESQQRDVLDSRQLLLQQSDRDDDQMTIDCDQTMVAGSSTILVQSSWIPAPDLPELSLSMLQPPSVSVGVSGGPSGGNAADSLMLAEHSAVNSRDDQSGMGDDSDDLQNMQAVGYSTREDDGPGLLEQLAARQECPTIIIAGNMGHQATVASMLPPPGSPMVTTATGGRITSVRSRGYARGIITHFRQETSSYEYRCALCGAIFFTKQSISRHMTDMHSNRTAYTCNNCNRQLSSQNALLVHMSRCQQMAPAATSAYPTSSVDLPGPSSAIQPLDDEEQSVSPDQLQFGTPATGEATTLKPNTCQFCGRSFAKPSDLTRHERTHTGARPFRCDQCGKSFRLKSALTGHQQTHQPREERTIHQCHLCKASLGSRTSLVVHLRQHTGIEPYRCPHCQEKFSTAGKRQSHILSAHINPSQSKAQ